jgi:hypothetical protein
MGTASRSWLFCCSFRDICGLVLVTGRPCYTEICGDELRKTPSIAFIQATNWNCDLTITKLRNMSATHLRATFYRKDVAVNVLGPFYSATPIFVWGITKSLGLNNWFRTENHIMDLPSTKQEYYTLHPDFRFLLVWCKKRKQNKVHIRELSRPSASRKSAPYFIATCTTYIYFRSTNIANKILLNCLPSESHEWAW